MQLRYVRVLHCRIGTVDADTFYDFTQRLLKLLLPFNGINPNSLVVLDNCAIHHVPELPELIRSVGALVKFLPTYSPDLMPIELAFGKIKGYIKEQEAAYLASDNPELFILAGFASITASDCEQWCIDCGYEL